jgi:NCK-associated protein 1
MFKSGIYYHLENKFPSLDIHERGKYDQFTAKAHAINGELENAYRTMCLTVDYLNQSFEFMQKFLQEIVMFNYEINRDMTVAVLDIVTLYVKIHFLMARFEKAKLVAAAYAASYEATHTGERAREFDTLASFLSKYAGKDTETVVAEMRKIFQADSHTIASGLHLVMNTYMKIEDFQTLRRKNIFEIIVLSNESVDLVEPVTDTIYDDLMNISKFSNWVLLILLVIPDQLAAPQSKQLLKIALEDCYRVRIFRDEFLLPHPEIQKQVAQMKKLKKLLKGGVKKLVNNAEFVAVEQACFKHRNRRKFLCVSLRQITNFLRNSPGLLGPKFPVIVSALSVTKHELEWYFRHHKAEPEKKGFFTMSKVPTHTPSHWLDTQRPHLTEEEAASVPQFHTVSELIHLSVSLHQFVRNNMNVVREYYLDYIRGADLTAVNEAISSGVLRHFPHVKSNMDDIRSLLKSTFSFFSSFSTPYDLMSLQISLLTSKKYLITHTHTQQVRRE